MPLIDSHAHLDFEEFGADRAATLERARAAGVVHVVLIGQWAEPKKEEAEEEPGAQPRSTWRGRAASGLAAAREVVELARRDRAFFSATAGVHPHTAGKVSAQELDQLAELCLDDAVVAVGECGLDYHYDLSPREVQRERFAWQVRLARELGKPVVVHTREADEDTASLLEREMGPQGGVIHCFTGDWTAAQRYLALGMHISLSGVLTFKNSAALRDAAARIPLDRLLVETDSPFLAPVPHRGKRNEPAYVAHTAARLAEVRGRSLAEIEQATTANARRVLRLPP